MEADVPQIPMNARPTFGSVLSRYWFYLGLLTMFVVGWRWPGVGLRMDATGFTPYLIAFAFFLNGFGLSTNSLVDGIKQWRVLGMALIMTFVISPALVFGMRQLLPGSDTYIAHGFQLASLVPTLFISAVVLTRLARGNAAVALCMTVGSNLLAIIVAPLLVKLTLGSSGANLNLASTSTNLLLTVLLPTVLGQLARKRWEVWATRYARLITVISQFTILPFIVTGFSLLPRAVLSPSVVVITIVGGMLLHVILLLLGHFSGRVIGVGEEERRALTFCSAQKSFVYNVLLADRIFIGNSTAYGLAILPGMIYYLIELSIDSVIAQHWSQQTPGHSL